MEEHTSAPQRPAIDALYDISHALSARAHWRERIVHVLERIEQTLNMQRATLLLRSDDGEELVFEATPTAAPRTTSPIKYRRGEGVTGKMLQTGKAMVIENIAEEEAFSHRIHRRDTDSHVIWAFICVPISIGTEDVGALSADIAREPTRNLSEDKQLLTVVASMIAHDVQMQRQARLSRQVLQEENRHLRSELDNLFRPPGMVGSGNRMRDVYERIAQVAPSNTTVMIRGESGTGKELVASAIHMASPRAEKPMVKVNCAALNENLLESELLGHEKGAFTGALQKRIGRLGQAEGGTLFLDEIGDFSPLIQVKLLRVLQEREYSRVGNNEVLKADVRFIVATNRNLEALVEKEAFRQDLYYRINVFPLYMPALRERREDILPLANFFVDKYARLAGKEIRRISTTAINMMMAYAWPGNVRELENCIEHAVLLCPGEAIQGSHLPQTLAMPEPADDTPLGSLTHRVEQLERDLITDAMKRNGGNTAAAARELQITTRILRYRIKKLGIDCKSM